MRPKEFRIRVKRLLDAQLPPGDEILNQGFALARDVSLGRTRFLDQLGVASESDYKRQCIRQGKIMFHAHIGMSTWEDTAQALQLLHRMGSKRRFAVDRFGLCLDRRMGLRPADRGRIPAETGPLLESGREWHAVGQTVPIQPHMGDFMIGFPSSTDNTLKALEAGVTTIGNLSQFFSHEAPGWHDHAATTVETVRAIAILGGLRKHGTLLHSYLEDGYGALFLDCATIAGWAYLERYIVEELIGAKLAHCIGGLTSDPVKRAGWVFALHEIHDGDCLGSMIYGDTISFSADYSANHGLVGEYLLWDILAQLKCPTGHAVHPLPETEGIRVPSAREIVEAQVLGKRIEASARRMLPHVNFDESHGFANEMIRSGKIVCDQALAGLKEAGVDIGNPVQLLYILKKLGPAVFEEMFGAGEPSPGSPRGRQPVRITDVFKRSQRIFAEYRPLFLDPDHRRLLNKKRLLIASSDVHEHAIMLLAELCRAAGAHCIYLGAEQPALMVARSAVREQVDAILISTHNGMALEYAQALHTELRNRRASIPVVMGGVLNQKVAGQALPLDVTRDLARLGFIPRAKLHDGFPALLDMPHSRDDS